LELAKKSQGPFRAFWSLRKNRKEPFRAFWSLRKIRKGLADIIHPVRSIYRRTLRQFEMHPAFFPALPKSPAGAMLGPAAGSCFFLPHFGGSGLRRQQKKSVFLQIQDNKQIWKTILI
jgi:hypothetical protein